MTRLPRTTGREIITALKKAGFQVARIKAAIIPFVILTGVERLFPSTPMRL